MGLSLTRRKSLKLSLSGLSLVPAKSTISYAKDTIDVTVIGAGLSGLYSAMLLEEQGFKVRVVEATNEIGGRVKSKNINGHIQELGASDIGIMYARVVDVADKLGLERVPTDIKVHPFSYYVRDNLVNLNDWETSSFNKTIGEERSIPPSRLLMTYLFKYNPLKSLEDWLDPRFSHLDIPLETYLKQKGISDEALRLMNVDVNCSDIGYSSALSRFADIARLQFGGYLNASKEQYGSDAVILGKIKGGNQKLPEAMAGSLKRNVYLNSIVQSIEYSKKQYEIKCENGKRYFSKFVVVTTPLTSLQGVKFSPLLPVDKMSAINEARYSGVAKIYLNIKKSFWDEDGFPASMWTDTPIERVFVRKESDGSSQNIIVWVNGDTTKKLDRIPKSEMKEYILNLLAKIRPSTRGKLEVVDSYSWSANRFSMGDSYDYGPGQITKFSKSISSSFNGLFFAGEHTRNLDLGMEAAMASSERVVSEILDKTS